MRSITTTKNILTLVISALILFICIGMFSTLSHAETFPWGEEPDVSLKVNGKTLELDVAPIIIESRTMVPARALFEELGGEVTWNADQRTVNIKYKSQTIVLTIDSKTATVDSKSKTLDVPAQIVKSRTLIPLRFVSESLGFTVGYDSVARIASVTTPVDTPDPVTLSNITRIYSVSGPDSNMYTKITVVSDTALTSSNYTGASVSNPDRYYIDFFNHTSAKEYLQTLTTITNSNSAVSSVRASQYTNTTVRLVFDLNESQKPEISLSSDKKTMTITFQKNSSPNTTVTPNGNENSNPNNTNPGDENNAPIVFNPYADGKLVVVLDPGHGASTGGKRSPDSSLMEYEFNRSVANRIKAILEKNGIGVIMTVSDNSDPSLMARCATANNSDADIFVSIHANAFGNGVDWENNATGWEIYHYSESSIGKIIAQYIHDASIPEIGIKDRGIKTANFYVIKNTEIPAVLIEHGFYTSSTEVELLKSDEWRQKAAECDAKGIMNFLYSYK